MPASSNFLPWNPGKSNQKDDTAYSSDTLRSGGATTAAILPSNTFNKLAYQTSIFAAAFCQMMANKGVSTSDANFDNLVAALTNVQLSADILSAIVTVSYATSVDFDCGASAQFALTLTGNVASSTVSNPHAGQNLAFVIIQDSTGGRTIAWPSALTSPGSVCSLANSISIQGFLVLPSGAIVPRTPMLWITSTGLFIPQLNVVSISASGTVSSASQEIFEKVNAAGGAVTRTLFAGAGRKGAKVNIKKMDASSNVVTCTAASGEFIESTAFSSFTIERQFDSYLFVADGAGVWTIH